MKKFLTFLLFFLPGILSLKCEICSNQIESEPKKVVDSNLLSYHKSCLLPEFIKQNSPPDDVQVGESKPWESGFLHCYFFSDRFFDISAKLNLTWPEQLKFIKQIQISKTDDLVWVAKNQEFCLNILENLNENCFKEVLDWSLDELPSLAHKIIVRFFERIRGDILKFSTAIALKSYKISPLQLKLINFLHFQDISIPASRENFLDVRDRIRNIMIIFLVKENSIRTALDFIEKNKKFNLTCLIAIAMLEQGYRAECEYFISEQSIIRKDSCLFAQYYIMKYKRIDGFFEKFMLSLNLREKQSVLDSLSPHISLYSDSWMWIIRQLKNEWLVFQAAISLNNFTLLPLEAAKEICSRFRNRSFFASLLLKNLQFYSPENEEYFDLILPHVINDNLLIVIKTKATNCGFFLFEDFISRKIKLSLQPFTSADLSLNPSEAFVNIPHDLEWCDYQIYGAYLTLIALINNFANNKAYDGLVLDLYQKNPRIFHEFHLSYLFYHKRDKFLNAMHVLMQNGRQF